MRKIRLKTLFGDEVDLILACGTLSVFFLGSFKYGWAVQTDLSSDLADLEAVDAVYEEYHIPIQCSVSVERIVK